MRLIPFLLVLFIPTIGISQEWATLYKNAQTNYDENKLEAAYEDGINALKKYQSESGETNDNYASILRLLSNVCYSQSKFNEGLDYAQKEIQIRESKNDLVLSGALGNAAQFQRQLGDYEKAIQLLIRSKGILQNFYSAEDNEILNCNLEIAITNYMANQNQEAFALFNDIFINKLKKVDSETANAYYYFGLLNLEMGNIERASTIFSELQKKYQESQQVETIEYALVVKGIAEIEHQTHQYEKSDLAYKESQQLFEKLNLLNEDEYLSLLNRRALNLEALGKIEQAESLFVIVSKHPEGKLAYAEALNNRAVISQAKGDFDQSQKFYEQALSSLDKTKPKEILLYAETLQNYALLEIEKKQTEKAINAIEESNLLIVQQLGGQHSRAISSLNKRASVYFQSGLIEKAKQDYTNSLLKITAVKSSPSTESIIALVGLAQCAQKLRNFQAADSIYQIAIGYYQSGALTRDEHYLSAIINYASVLQDEGRLKEAVISMQLAILYVKSSKGIQHPYYAFLMENIAMLNLKLGKTERAKQQLDSAYAFYDSDKKKTSDSYGSFLLSIGRFYQLTGDYSKAESTLRAGTNILLTNNGENNELYAYAINSLALYYQTMGNFSEAEPLFRKALTIREKTNGKLNTEYATVLQNLASLYQLEENYNKAEPLLQEANEIDRQVLGESHPQYLISLQNLATLYQKKKDLDKAAFMMISVRALTEKAYGKNHPSYATVISNIASLYQDQAKYQESETLWLESVNLRKSMLGENHPDYARSLYGLAGVYFATGKYKEAEPYFNLVVEKYQHQISTYFDALSEKEKSAFYNRIKPVFESYQDFCVQLLARNSTEVGISEKLYDLQLSTKAILLNASNKVRNAIMTSGDLELQLVFQQWQQAKEELVRSYSLTNEERARQNIDLAKEEQMANDLEKKLSERSSQFSLLGKKNIGWADVKSSLKINETAVEIIRIKKKYVTDSIYYAALVVNSSSTRPQLFIWPEGAKLENKWYKFHRNSIKFHQPDSLSFSHIWAPLLKVIPSSHTIFVSSDGVFNKLNLNCIQNPASKKWTIDEYNIRLVSNTRELTESRSSKQPTQQASIFGYADFNLSAANKVNVSAGGKRASRFGFQGEEIPMLPATKKEVDIINEVLKEKSWKISSFTLEEATEENLKKINSPQILHIATHGFFLNDVDIIDELESDEESNLVKNPLFRSGILLAGAGLQQTGVLEDGVLTAYEAMNLALDNTELVSLSACETGLGDVRNGEGVYGLQRSFLVAGARTVIMSLWQVDDEATQELMSSFYKKWISGTDKFEAFRLAQLEIKEKHPLPYYWGAFVLIGN